MLLGNHDYHTNPKSQIDYSTLSKKWQMPDEYYTFSKPNVDFFVLNTTELKKNLFFVPFWIFLVVEYKHLKW